MEEETRRRRADGGGDEEAARMEEEARVHGEDAVSLLPALPAFLAR